MILSHSHTHTHEIVDTSDLLINNIFVSFQHQRTLDINANYTYFLLNYSVYITSINKTK